MNGTQPPWASDEEIKAPSEPHVHEMNVTNAKVFLDGLDNVAAVKAEYELEKKSKARKSVMEFALQRIQDLGPKVDVIHELPKSKPSPVRPPAPKPLGISAKFVMRSGR